MSTLERKILNFMSFDKRYDLENFKDYISSRFDSDLDDVEDSILRLEEDGEIFRPEDGRITRLKL